MSENETKATHDVQRHFVYGQCCEVQEHSPVGNRSVRWEKIWMVTGKNIIWKHKMEGSGGRPFCHSN